ncbi:unnamed protein product [Prunus brigantina]
MSDHEHKDLYYHDLFQYEDHEHLNGGMISINHNQNLQGIEVPSYMNNTSFAECLKGPMDYNTLATAFGLASSTSDEVIFSSANEGDQKPAEHIRYSGGGGDGDGGGGETPLTPNSSVSSSSAEAGAEEDSGKSKKDRQPKGSSEDGGDSSKKVMSKAKKKGEKKQREPRFAFMTKSEVDHLEDGYRWRKYGQKAVKNSPYPRSYYRCTTQKCGVKKRVERSFEDPSTVITTYEGQHNHPLPATLRGNAAASSAFFPHAAAAFNYAPITGSAGPSSNFPQELLFQMPHHYMINNNNQGSSRSVVVNPHHPHHQQQHQLPRADQRGLLQDLLFPSMFLKQEP